MSTKKERRHMRPWNERELRTLRKYAADKLPAREAAKRLGRSHGAVRYKAMVDGIVFRSIDQSHTAQAKANRTKKAKALKRSAAAKKGAAVRAARGLASAGLKV